MLCATDVLANGRHHAWAVDALGTGYSRMDVVMLWPWMPCELDALAKAVLTTTKEANHSCHARHRGYYPAAQQQDRLWEEFVWVPSGRAFYCVSPASTSPSQRKPKAQNLLLRFHMFPRGCGQRLGGESTSLG